MSFKNKNVQNPHGICSCSDESRCGNCGQSKELNCRFNYKGLLQFYLIFLPFLIFSLIGVREAGYSSFIKGWGVMAIVFFGFWEIYILCSHCPYYARKGFTLKCLANHGCPKFWKYNPGPIGSFKKAQLIIGFIAMGGYPFIFMALGNQPLYFVLSLAGLMFFFGALLRFKCTRCINFSCFFNRVPKELADDYIIKNPVMKEAWEKAGYRFDKGNNRN